MTQTTTQERKKSFSSFTYKEAFKHLGINELQRWSTSATLELDGSVAESLLYGIGEMPILLGILRDFFGLCQQNLVT